MSERALAKTRVTCQCMPITTTIYRLHRSCRLLPARRFALQSGDEKWESKAVTLKGLYTASLHSYMAQSSPLHIPRLLPLRLSPRSK